jgi:CxxC motif-containing protein
MEKRVLSVIGNACKRGVKYAEDECTDPRRTITSTVATESGRVVPVKTNGAIPKDLIFPAMERINAIVARDDVDVGDVIEENFLDTGISLVCTGRGE